MTKYNYENLEREILKDINVDKNDSKVMIALYDGKTSVYPFDFSGNGPILVSDIENAFLNFFNTVTGNENFDLTNFRTNLNKNFIIGVQNEDVNPNAGTTIFDESKNLLGIFADHNLVDTGVIYHELFHFASRPNGGHTFRRGLNEGYTEALTHRYFNKSKVSYPDNVNYALELENIIGQDVMENAYSKGDISFIKDILGEENMYAFDAFNDKMDLLLGSYYRVNNGKALPDEDKRVLKAKKDLDEYLGFFAALKQEKKTK